MLTDEKNVDVTVHVNNLKPCNDTNMLPKKISTRGRPRKKVLSS